MSLLSHSGDDANKFASWLHRAMTKLKAMTTEKQKGKEESSKSKEGASETAKSAIAQ